MIVLLILALLCAAYWPAFQAGWIWDDDAYVTANPGVVAPDGWLTPWIPGITPQYYPLVFDSFWLQAAIHGLDPLWFHAVNVALHGLSTVVLWIILRRLRVPGALLAAMIFGLHPVQVESVAWVTERKNVLSMAFALFAVLSWINWRDNSIFRWLAAAGIAYVAALLSKSTAVAVPVAIAVIEYWSGKPDSKRLRVLAPIGAMFVVGIAFGLHTAYVEVHHVGASGAEFSRPFVERLAQASQAWWYYPYSWIWPSELVFIQTPFRQGPDGYFPWVALAAILALVAGCCIAARRGARGPLSLLLVYAAGVFPALGFLNVYPLRFAPVADHFGYVAGVAVCVSLGWALATGRRVLFSRLEGRGQGYSSMLNGVALAACGLLALVLCTLTWAQAWQYKDEPTLWTWTLRRNPQAWLASNFLGATDMERASVALQRNDQAAASALLASAEALLQQAVDASHHADASPLANLSEVRRMQGRLAEALGLLNHAITVDPTMAKSYWSRARVLEQMGRDGDAGADFLRAASLPPRNPLIERDVVRWHAMHGHLEQALLASDALLAAWPPKAEDLANNASILLQLGRTEAARAMFERALAASEPAQSSRLLLPMTEAYLQEPHTEAAVRRAMQLAERLRSLAGEGQPQPLYLLVRAHALAGHPDNAAKLMEQADSLLPHVPPQARPACEEARAKAAKMLNAQPPALLR